VEVFEISMNVTEYVSRRLNECDTRFPFENTLDFVIELNEILRELLTIEIVHVSCGVFNMATMRWRGDGEKRCLYPEADSAQFWW
jgi:hypothetical protein